MDEVPEDVVGRRVCCDGDYGSVRFAGEVPPTKGFYSLMCDANCCPKLFFRDCPIECSLSFLMFHLPRLEESEERGLWLGVEWDDPERGKHDGSHGGVRYFDCQHPKGGSFIRPKKADLGVPLLSAMEKRYSRLQDIGEDLPEYTFSTGLGAQTISVKLVGMDKSFQEQRCLMMVNLSQLGVSSAGPANAIREACPNIKELNLSLSLLHSWQEVALIAEQLCNLSILILGKNRLRIPETPGSLSHCFSQLTVLVLNSCCLTWSQVLVCAEMWPNVEQLELMKNNITTLERPEGVLQALRSLNLEGNCLESSEQINHIAMLPSLESLQLNDCGLTRVHFDDVQYGCHTSMFPKLKFVSLYKNQISEWSSVNELDKLQGLEEMNLSLESLVTPDVNPSTVRQIIIAKIARLRVLNHCQVCREERRGADLDYLKRYGLEWIKAGGRQNGELGITSAEFMAAHPRYAALVHKYGAPEDSELKKQSLTLKSNLIAVNITCPDLPDHKTIQKKLLNTMTVQKLKGMLSRLLKVEASDLVLTYMSHKIQGSEECQLNDFRQLNFYAMEDGDSLVVRW